MIDGSVYLSRQYTVRGIAEEGMGRVKTENQEESTGIQKQEDVLNVLQNAEQTNWTLRTS